MRCLFAALNGCSWPMSAVTAGNVERLLPLAADAQSRVFEKRIGGRPVRARHQPLDEIALKCRPLTRSGHRLLCISPN